MRSKKAVQKWYHRTQVTLYLRRRNEQVIDQYRKKRLSLLWAAWRKNLRDEKKGNMMMLKFVNRMQYFDFAKAFQKWQQVTAACRARDSDNKEFGSNRLGQLLNRMVRRRQAQAMHAMKRRTMKKDFKRQFLKRMLTHSAQRRLLEYFERWKNFTNCQNIADTVNVSYNKQKIQILNSFFAYFRKREMSS